MEALMRSYTVTQARKEIYQLVASTAEEHEPIQITGKDNNAILISEADWNAIQETLYLDAIPGMTDSIVEGMNTPVDSCANSLFDEDDV